ncbi:MAG TPA: hypothetical protein VLA60_10625, partial [Nitrospirales bacterium]|nr:hypothetical protein [Nitrospirales bacterium]
MKIFLFDLVGNQRINGNNEPPSWMPAYSMGTGDVQNPFSPSFLPVTMAFIKGKQRYPLDEYKEIQPFLGHIPRKRPPHSR